MYFFDELKAKLEGKKVKIVFPEGHDIRVLKACVKLFKDGVVDPIVLGRKEVIDSLVKEHGLDVTGMTFLDGPTYPFDQMELLVQALVKRRAGKISEYDALKTLMINRNYFGTMLVYSGLADGLVSGADNSTADTIRPGLQIIKCREGINKASGIFFLVKNEERLYFADCGINIMPSAQDIAESAVVAAGTVKQFNDEARIALLSFSSKGSACSPEQQKMVEAFKLTKEMAPDLLVDGELQFDAAYVPEVAAKKAPYSPLKGRANVFIFPTLDAGNIGYKIAERLGGYEAVGPVLQGLAAPINDLSRGCNERDVYNLGLITAVQALDRN